ncbi:Leucine rich repeat-containing protein [Lachnospiraceae bacterium]|nr:Leucine rich repeat-containing protein [Lachnospiraceae bacterium]
MSNLGGVKFKVTAIANNTFKGSKIQKLTVGKYVTQIGKNAANGCFDLKSIKIKSKVLKKIGSKAFYNINENAKFKVPKNKLSKYKKMIKKAKAPKKAKITK